MKLVHLYDIERGSKILCEASDGSTFVTFGHLDGMYSYCTTEKGAVVHLSVSTRLVREGDAYRLATDEEIVNEEE